MLELVGDMADLRETHGNNKDRMVIEGHSSAVKPSGSLFQSWRLTVLWTGLSGMIIVLLGELSLAMVRYFAVANFPVRSLT